MSRKQFTLEQKLKYINLSFETDFETAVIYFVEEFWEERYKETYLNRQFKKAAVCPYHYGKTLLKKWIKIYNNGMENLISKTGKSSKKGLRRKQEKVSINELNEHDRALYQEIMEEILEDYGVKPSIIIDRIKKKKSESKMFSNLKKVSKILNFNRTSVYKNYISKKRQTNKEKYINPLIINWLREKIQLSNYTIGRDKLYYKYLNDVKNFVSSYVFRLNFEKLEYRSKAYKRQSKENIPKEIKARNVWTEDLIKGNFSSEYFGEKLHADIKYVKIGREWFYLHVITETFSDSILSWDLTTERNSELTIDLVKRCLSDFKIVPKFFHTDHGIEYANFKFKEFLNSQNIKQSMSPKGNSLANRPSEYLFAVIQRELFDQYDISSLTYQQVFELISKFVLWYNTERPQKNLQYKTPHAVLQHEVLCV